MILRTIELENFGLYAGRQVLDLVPRRRPGGETPVVLFGGRNGTAVIEEEQLVAWQFRDEEPDDDAIRARFNAASRTSGGAADPMAINYACHTRNFEEFLAAVRDGRQPPLDGLEGRKAVAIVEACYKSARTGRAATVENPPPAPSP